jgi:hypothetical protein
MFPTKTHVMSLCVCDEASLGGTDPAENWKSVKPVLEGHFQCRQNQPILQSLSDLSHTLSFF